MIEVQLPDGRIVEFPDGTSQDVMRQALHSLTEPQAQQPPAQRNPDGTYGQPPADMFQNPHTGQMTSRDMLRANVQPSRMGAFVSGGAQGSMFGGADEAVGAISGAMGGDANFDREQTRAEFEANRAAYPGTSIGSEIGGSIMSALLAARLGVGGAVAGLPGAVAKSAATGAAQGGAYGFLSGEGGLGNRATSAATSAALGGGIGLLVPALGALGKGVADNIMEARAVKAAIRNAPSTAELRAMGNAAYQAVDDAGVQIAPDAVRSLGDDLVRDMRAGGLDTGSMSLTPQSARLAEVVREVVPDGSTGVPFRDLEVLRRKAGVPASNMGNKVEAALGGRVIGGLDDFVGNITPGQVVAGNADDLAENIGKAREIWQRMSKSQMIEDAIDASENYLSGASSGIRNQFSRIMKSPKLSRGFSEVEKRAMRKVVNGSIPEQLLNLAGGGIGQLATIGGGAAAGGPVGAVVGAGVASLARKGSEALSRRGAEGVRALIASGGIAQAPQSSPVLRQLLERWLLSGTPLTSSAISGQFQPR